MSWLWPLSLIWSSNKGKKRKDNIILSYTEDLNKLSIEINSIEKKLNEKSPYVRYFHFYVLPLLLSIIYYYVHRYSGRLTQFSRRNLNLDLSGWIIYVVLTLVIYTTIIYILLKLKSWERKYRTNKLSKLHSQYDNTLNQFKEDTKFNESISMLQRFNGGVDQIELVNEELKGKYEELDKLRLEIDKLKNKGGDYYDNSNSNNKVWLDKIVGLMSGGNDILVKVLCPKCKKFNGLYRYVNEPIGYKCVDCDMEVYEIEKGNEETSEKKEEGKDK